MDESWRTPIGSVVPRLTSTAEKEVRRSRRPGQEGLHPDDFSDVFGGPPRTVLLRRFSSELSAGRATFYDEIFRPAGESSLRVARNLPGFSIPSSGGRLLRTEEGFYDDIFRSGSGGDRRSKLTSRSEDTSSPLRPEDAMLSSITSRLRPITIPARRRPCSSSSSMPSTTSSEGGEQISNRRTTPTIPCSSTPRSCFMDFQDDDNSSSSSRKSTTHLFRQQQRSHHPCCFSLEPISFIRGGCRSLKKHMDDADTDNSPSSVISSAFTNQLAPNHHKWPEQEQELEEAMVQAASEEGAAALDEAIAWAKHKFWNQTSNEFDEVVDGETHDLLGKGKEIESITCPRKPLMSKTHERKERVERGQ